MATLTDIETGPIGLINHALDRLYAWEGTERSLARAAREDDGPHANAASNYLDLIVALERAREGVVAIIMDAS